MHGLLTDDAPAWLVVISTEVPFIIYEGLGLVCFKRATIFVHMHERPLPKFRRLRSVNPGFLHQVISHDVAGLLYFALNGFKLELCAVLEKFFQHFLRDWLATRLTGLVLLHAQLLKELDKFGLEVPAEIHFLSSFVLLLPIRSHLHFHALRYLLEKGFHLIRVNVFLFHVFSHIEVVPVLRRNFFVGNLGNDCVDSQRSFRGVLHGRLWIEHLSNYAPDLARLLLVLLRGWQSYILLQAQSNQELDHCLAHGKLSDVGTAGQRVSLHLSVGATDAAILMLDAGVKAGFLDDRVNVQGEFTVVEEVEEALHVRHVSSFENLSVHFRRVAVFAARRCRGLSAREVIAQVVEHCGRSVEHEPEAAEFKTGNLMSGNHLEPIEVLQFSQVAIDERGQEDRCAFRCGCFAGHPADVLVREFATLRKLDVCACQTTAVHLHHILDARELYTGREGFQHLLGAG